MHRAEEAVKLLAPAAESQVVGEGEQGSKTDKPAIVGECPGVEILVSGVKVPCLLDTGSQVTLFSECFFQKWLGGETKRSPQDLQWLTLKAANGLQIPYTGYAILDFSVGGVQVPGKGVIIVKDECLGAERGILGMNVISHCWRELFQGVHPGMTAFGATMSTQARGEWERAFAICQRVSLTEPSDGQVGVARLTRQDPVYIPPNSEMVLWTQLYGAQTSRKFCAMVEGLEQDGEWQVGRSIAWVVKGRLPVRVRNVNPYPVEMPQRCPLANVFQVDPGQVQGEMDLVLTALDVGVVEVDVQKNQMTTEVDHPVNRLKGEGLSAEQQRKMDDLLQRWKAVFAVDEEDFGRTSIVRHSIPTGSAPPSRQRYRPVPPSLYSELRGLLQNMLQQEVIRESSSPWAAPIVLVKKKDGSWRFCVDYRKLNALTHKDAYPLPRIEESLTCLTKAAWYSTLDLASGYWQVEMDPRDREKTAFTTPLGLFEFQRMPFGLCNAPATFQRLMQRCLGGQVNESLLIYLDDVIVFSPDFDTHLQHLELVFRKLAAHGLKLQPPKCKLFQRKVTYLGHVISKDGISTDPEKTAVVQSWPVPSTTKQVRSFLGFVGYYRRFIKGFSKVAAPLHALLVGTAGMKKGPVTVQWTTDCQVAFDTLKTALVSAPILGYADFSKPFHLYTDASLAGLGAVLAQVQDGQERVMAYASRSLSPTERNDQNYSSFKLEFLALKWAVTEKFRDYLWGHKFVAFTDNNPLVHLDTAHLGATEQRWAAQLANFDFELKYRPGSSNRNADLLSRLPQEAESCGLQASEETAVVESEDSRATCESWKSCQEEDQVLSRVLEWVSRGHHPTTEASRGELPAVRRHLREWKRLYIQDGTLRRRAQDHNTGLTLAQIVVPRSKTRDLWEQYHRTSGHMGVAKIEALLRKTFYWPGMGSDLQDWTSTCFHCLQHKSGLEVRAPLVPILTSYPLETVAVDYLSLGRPADTYPYLLVITDLFSKYGWAVPTKDQTAATTVHALWRHLIQPWGCPERILSDRGATFESSLVAQLCSLYGCAKVRTTPYRPQGNGACERFNKTLLSLLTGLHPDDQTRWPDHLPTLLQIYNNTPHETTGLTPHFVMFGRHARLPVDTIAGAPPTTQGYDLDGWVRQHHQTLQQVYRRVVDKTKETRMRDKNRYDRKTRSTPLLAGERVLLRNFRRREQGKLAPRWMPQPYVVLEQLRPSLPVFRIKPEGKDGPTRTIHQNHLRPCPFNPPDRPQPVPEAAIQNPVAPSAPSPRPLLLPLTFVPTASTSLTGQGQGTLIGPPEVPLTTTPLEQDASNGPLTRRSQRPNLGRPPDRYGY